MSYSIFSDDDLVYSPELAPEGYDAFNICMTQELNKAGSLEFTLSPKSEMYNGMTILASTITMWDGVRESDGRNMVFRGRIIQITRDFYNNKTFYCEGELAFLNDRVLKPYNKTDSPANIWAYFNQHSSGVKPNRSFYWGVCDIEDPNNLIVRSNQEYTNLFSEITDKFINKYDCYLYVSGTETSRRLNLQVDPYPVSSQFIEFGKNLLDLEDFIDATSLYTVLYPIGARDETTGERLKINSVNDDKPYLEDTDLSAIYGRIATFKVWDDVTVPANLKSKGEGELYRIGRMTTSLTVKAIDLHLLDVNIASIKLGGKHRVLSAPHGLDTTVRCSKVVVYPDQPDKNEYTFGVVRKTLTDWKGVD